MPHLEDDPLGGDPLDVYFGPDSGDEEIPCGQKDNLTSMFDSAESLETPVPAQVGELRAPPAPPLPPAVQTAPVASPAPAIDLAMLVAALREAIPPPPQPQAEVAQSLVAIGQTLSALSDKMDSCRGLGKRARSRSPSPPSSPPPPHEKRSRPRSRSRSPSISRSHSPSPSRSGRSSSTSSQFSDQSEDESPPPRDEEALDLGIPPLGDRSALDHELLTTEDELDRTEVAAPAVAPQPTPGTSRAPPSVYTRLGPPTDTVADTAREPVRSWRELWESH